MMESGIFDMISNFFYMDGRWSYIWSAYAVAALVLAINVILPKLIRGSIEKQIRRRIELEKE
jgi:heme exporter protein CcmD